MPYDTLVAYDGANRAATLTDDRLADYAANPARYHAVILATGDLVHNVANANGTTSYLSALSYWVGGKPEYRWQYVNAGTTGAAAAGGGNPYCAY